MTTYPHICGFGYCTPKKELTNAELASRCAITEEWIESRTGIRARRVLEAPMTGTDLALVASRAALDKAGLTAGQITHILYGTCTSDASCPSSACILAGKLGLEGLMAIEYNAACSGFLYGLELARGLAAISPEARILVVAAESLSHRCNFEDPGTAVLFGDGAGAVIVTGKNAHVSSGLLQGALTDVILGSDGAKGSLLLVTGGYASEPYAIGSTVGPEYFIRMQGKLVYREAVRRMSKCCQDLLDRNGLTAADVDCFVPHQANMRIIEAVGSRINIPLEKVFLNVHKYGNTSAASIPLALGEAVEQDAIRPGMTVLLTTFGAGMTWGAALLRF